ncbi:uncharacterized protein J4E88_002999 [Alternaria novae-zelandiae]|uniref:uncharacterized protein n=1 Tax=Alternaria novae-zelandiae TaxID=430562 RepID=UPI0020C33860|nr:uncharacterized protein J4E88_002999 [Alternaria novae-zelandiae]KAI4689644.1 hypothetical protein J4E88_002999 [Alternaria novae-zelandiae]
MTDAQTADTASFLKLPTELLDQIASLLPRSALRALALASKKASVSAIDTLYKTYLNRTAPAKAPFHLFLRTVCERPDLTAKVKRVDIRGWRSEYEVATGAAWRGVTEVKDVDQIEKSGPCFTSTEKIVRDSATARFKLFVGAAVKAGIVSEPTSLSASALKASIVWYTSLKEDGDFLRLLGRGVEDAQLVLILALLPNMEVLRVDGLSPFPLLDCTALRKLSVLQIKGSYTNSKEPVVKSSLQFLDIMPNLRTIHLYHVAAGGHKFTINALSSTKLQGVALLECGIHARLLRKIMLGQSLVVIAYRPGPAQIDAVTGSDIALPDLLDSFAHSKLSLQTLMLFPSSTKPQKSNLKNFENLKTLEIPLFEVLSIPHDEAEPEAIHAFLKDQLPTSLNHIALRYMTSSIQTKIVIEQLAVLKMQNMLPDLDKATFNFMSAVPSSFVSTAMFNIYRPTGGLAAGMRWESLPEMEKMVREDCGKLYQDAGICMVVEQTDY